MPLHPLADLIPIQPGHPDVQQQQLRRIRAHAEQRLLAIVGVQAIVAHRRKVTIQQLNVPLVVIGDQHAGSRYQSQVIRCHSPQSIQVFRCSGVRCSAGWRYPTRTPNTEHLT